MVKIPSHHVFPRLNFRAEAAAALLPRSPSISRFAEFQQASVIFVQEYINLISFLLIPNKFHKFLASNIFTTASLFLVNLRFPLTLSGL